MLRKTTIYWIYLATKKVGFSLDSVLLYSVHVQSTWSPEIKIQKPTLTMSSNHV